MRRLNELADYLMTFSALEMVNVLAAIACCVVAFSAINLMNKVATHRDVMATVTHFRRSGMGWATSILYGLRSAETMSLSCSFATLCAGTFGYAMGTLTGRWQQPFDTLLFFGVLAMLVANRRGWSRHLSTSGVSLGITAAGWLIFMWGVS